MYNVQHLHSKRQTCHDIYIDLSQNNHSEVIGGDFFNIISFIFSLNFLLLEIQMFGVTAMATSQARPGPMKLNTSTH